ncbi:MAG: TMEM175 family protein [Candidatus Micrarchaeia archaeon]|jgi:uncharacterized membrane protein
MAEKPESVSMHRIEALTDGIFAFAMTMLVLSINIPLSPSSLAGMSVGETLLGQTDRFVNYATSFLLLAIFWVSHHRVFDHLKGVDWKLVWGNVILLLFIALVPFSMELTNEFTKDPVADFLFGLNMFIIGTIYYLLWAYATDHRRLVKPSLNNEHIQRTKKALLTISLISLLSMFVAFVYPSLAPLVFLIIPILLFFPKLKSK